MTIILTDETGRRIAQKLGYHKVYRLGRASYQVSVAEEDDAETLAEIINQEGGAALVDRLPVAT